MKTISPQTLHVFTVDAHPYVAHVFFENEMRHWHADITERQLGIRYVFTAGISPVHAVDGLMGALRRYAPHEDDNATNEPTSRWKALLDFYGTSGDGVLMELRRQLPHGVQCGDGRTSGACFCHYIAMGGI